MYRQSIQENQTKINTVDWNAGIYFYRIESTEGVSKSFKMEVIK